MDNQKIFYIIIILLTYSIIHYFFFTESTVIIEETTVVEGHPRKLSRKLKLTSEKIDGIDRFDWYRKKMFERTKLKETKKTAEISLLHAYELDFEIAVSYTTPGIEGSTVFCRYLDKTGAEIGNPAESITFPEFVIYCPKREGTVSMSISVEKNGNSEFPVPLEDRMEKEFKNEFSMCMSSIYGEESKWLLFSELIEHYKLQGITKFYFYIHSLNTYDRVILEDYVRTGEVELHYLLERNSRENLHWQIVTYRDCTLRNKMESKWTIFADLDERLLMTKYPGTILDYLKNIKKPEIGGIVFRQQWIMKTEFMPTAYENEKQITEWMPTLRWHNSSAIGPVGHTVKTIIDPLKTVAMWTHYPQILYPGFRLQNLEPEEGLVRHYRDLKMWNWGNTWLKDIIAMGPMSMTNYPDKYQKILEENVQKRVKYVYAKYKPDDKI